MTSYGLEIIAYEKNQDSIDDNDLAAPLESYIVNAKKIAQI